MDEVIGSVRKLLIKGLFFDKERLRVTQIGQMCARFDWRICVRI